MIPKTKKVAVKLLTVLWDLPCAPFKEQTNTPASRLDQLNGPGVGHVPGCFSIDLNDLVPYLKVRKCVTENKRSCQHLSERKCVCTFHQEWFS